MAEEFSAAVAHFQAGRWNEAVSVCRSILGHQPRHADAWQMLGLVLCQTGNLEEAVPALEKAERLRPQDPALANNLGEAYRQLGRLSESESALRRALQLKPAFAEAAFNLGNTLRDQGRPAEAVENFQQAVALRPDYAKAHLNLANTLRSEGRLPRAAEHYRHYLKLQPSRCDVLLSLAGVYADLGEHHQAEPLIQQASALEPENPPVISAAGNLSLAQGRADEARSDFQRLANREPKALLPRLRAATVCPVIPQDREEIHDHQRRLLHTLEELRAQRLNVDVTQLHSSGAEPPMLWAYYGLDNRPMKEAFARLFSDSIRPLDLKPRTGKARVGVVVTYGHEGVYAECLGRLVARLPSSELDVTVICSAAGVNILRHLLGDTGLPHLAIPDRVDEAAARIRDENFDLLLYWEIGTGSQNYFLPFFRPAPVQCACWGWPVTSGQPHVDYFLSSSLIESDDADAHYTERLVRLRTLPTWYARPPVPERLQTRTSCSLPSDGSLYLCTQNLRKYHPDFDEVLGEVLRRDPTGYVGIIEDAQRAITRLLQERLLRRIPDVARRVIFLPRRPRAEYLHVVTLADVMLDTLHYGGGANSLLDAFACGTPVVSLPGPFHRSRWALGACRRMGIPELIAESPEEYVAKALRTALEPEFRRDLHNRILSANSVLFGDDDAVAAHREFMLQAIAESRRA